MQKTNALRKIQSFAGLKHARAIMKGLLVGGALAPLLAYAATTATTSGSRVSSIFLRTTGPCLELQGEIQDEQSGDTADTGTVDTGSTSSTGATDVNGGGTDTPGDVDQLPTQQQIQDQVRTLGCRFTAHVRRRGAGNVANARLVLERRVVFSNGSSSSSSSTGASAISSSSASSFVSSSSVSSASSSVFTGSSSSIGAGFSSTASLGTEFSSTASLGSEFSSTANFGTGSSAGNIGSGFSSTASLGNQFSSNPTISSASGTAGGGIVSFVRQGNIGSNGAGSNSSGAGSISASGFTAVSTVRVSNSRGVVTWRILLPENECDIYRVRSLADNVTSNRILLGLNSSAVSTGFGDTFTICGTGTDGSATSTASGIGGGTGTSTTTSGSSGGTAGIAGGHIGSNGMK